MAEQIVGVDTVGHRVPDSDRIWLDVVGGQPAVVHRVVDPLQEPAGLRVPLVVMEDLERGAARLDDEILCRPGRDADGRGGEVNPAFPKDALALQCGCLDLQVAEMIFAKLVRQIDYRPALELNEIMLSIH